MSAALAGLLRERVAVTRRQGRDALGGISGEERALGEAWAGFAAEGPGRWRATMRPREIAAGDVLERAGGRLTVTAVIADPRTPDRITLHAEDQP